MEYSKKGEISDLEILLLLAFSADGKALTLPFSQFYRDDDKKESSGQGCRGNYWNKLLHLVIKQGDEDKKLYQDRIMLKKIKEDSLPLEDHLVFKKTCLLYDWIKEDRDIKTIEQENRLYGGVIQVLGEGFSWLADSLMEIAENEGWRKGREEDLNKIKILSKRLIDGVEEGGLSLSRMHIPGLSRYYIRSLVGAGYNNGKCLKEASEEELNKILPNRLVNRIQERTKEEKVTQEVKKQKLIVEAEYPKPEPAILPSPLKTTNTTSASHNLQPASASTPPKTENCVAQLAPCTLQPILEIDRHRPDRIIFMGEKIEVTATEFSLIHLLAQHNGQVMSYDELLDTLWKDEEDAIYSRVSYHFSKIRSTILKTIGKSKRNKEKVKNIFKVISRRGIMLNLEEDKLKIN
jgi:helicase